MRSRSVAQARTAPRSCWREREPKPIPGDRSLTLSPPHHEDSALGFLKRMLGIATRTSQGPRVVLTARLETPEQGPPEIGWHPSMVEPETLGLLSVCYGAHVGWSVGEYHQLRALLWSIGGQLGSLRANKLEDDDLLGLIPVANSWRAGILGHPTAAPGGEVFELQLILGPSRTPGVDHDVAVVDRTSTPNGAITNIPWSAFLITAEVWRHLDVPRRTRLVEGWRNLKKLLTKKGRIQPGNPDHLYSLYEAVTREWTSSCP